MRSRLGSCMLGSIPHLPPGPSYTDTILVNQTAIQGQGIAIGRRALVDDALTQGLLAHPFKIVRPANYAYRIGMTPSAAETRAAMTFRDWLLEMADEAAVGQRPGRNNAPLGQRAGFA